MLCLKSNFFFQHKIFFGYFMETTHQHLFRGGILFRQKLNFSLQFQYENSNSKFWFGIFPGNKKKTHYPSKVQNSRSKGEKLSLSPMFSRLCCFVIFFSLSHIHWVLLRLFVGFLGCLWLSVFLLFNFNDCRLERKIIIQ